MSSIKNTKEPLDKKGLHSITFQGNQCSSLLFGIQFHFFQRKMKSKANWSASKWNTKKKWASIGLTGPQDTN